MATLEQQQELIETLKFTPRTYKIYIGGYGGESYAGTVSKEIYEFFKEKKIDIEQYATDWDDLFGDVPRELQPYSPGSPYDCDNLFHASGAEMSNSNEIQIIDENGNDHWSCAAGLNELEDAGVNVNEWGGCNLDDLPEDTIVHWGGQGEKGTFFDGEFELTQPFNPKLLTVSYENCDGWWIINGVEYDGVEIDGSNGYSTTGKWNETKWILCNGDEPYEGEERDEDYVAESTEQTFHAETTEWFDKAVKPAHKGNYEVMIDAPWPNGGVGLVEWTGRSWKQDGKKVAIVQWRGLKFKPRSM
jgi:hypothetical protein